MSALIDALDKALPGKHHRPGDAAYASGVHVFTSSIDFYPQASVQCRSAEDVATGVKIARDLGIEVSVRGGGHNSAGLALRSRGGLLLDCSDWREVTVDPDRRIAVSAPGATWGDYDAVTQQHELASPGGVVSSTGVAGLTLSGGIGALRGRHGLACDNLRAFDIVLADGSLKTVDQASDADLFWAVRGGGSNFGIVTRFEFDVHPCAREVCGMMVWPLDQAMAVLEQYSKHADQYDDNYSTDFFLLRMPGNPDPVIGAIPRYIGTWEESRAAIEPLRATNPIEDQVVEMSYCDSQKYLDPMIVWQLRQLWRTRTLATYDLDALAVLVDFFRRAPSEFSNVIIEHLVPGTHRAGDAASSVGFRGAALNLMMVSSWTDRARDAENQAWIRDLGEAMARFPSKGAYTNYLAQDATEADLKRAFRDNYPRLQKIKAAYDPDNFFRCNQNILPRA